MRFYLVTDYSQGDPRPKLLNVSLITTVHRWWMGKGNPTNPEGWHYEIRFGSNETVHLLEAEYKQIEERENWPRITDRDARLVP